MIMEDSPQSIVIDATALIDFLGSEKSKNQKTKNTLLTKDHGIIEV